MSSQSLEMSTNDYVSCRSFEDCEFTQNSGGLQLFVIPWAFLLSGFCKLRNEAVAFIGGGTNS